MKTDNHKDRLAITIAADETEIVRGSQWGELTWMEWCLHEIERIRKMGREARIGRSHGKCWVSKVRSSNGVCHE